MHDNVWYFFHIEAGYPQFFLSQYLLTRPSFSHSHKPRKITFELVCIFLKKLEVPRP